MNQRRFYWAASAVYLALNVLLLQAQSVPPALPQPIPATSTNTETVNAADLSRTVTLIQTQWKATQEALEATRQRAEAETRQSTLRLGEQLTRMETRLESRLDSQSGDKDQILRALQVSSQNAVRLASLLVGIGLFAVCLMSFLQWRATVQLTQLAARALPSRADLNSLQESSSLPLVGPSKETNRLIESLERLEHRIDDFEHGVSHPQAHEPKALGPAEAAPPVEPTRTAPPAPRITAPHRLSAPEKSKPGPSSNEGAEAGLPRLGILEILSKGEAFLQLGQPTEALRTFEEALSMQPAHAEAWVKKGSALERMERIEDALACYNQAIGLDGTFTLAYLYKGGICNRLERFDEALLCYEQALRSHETAAAS